GARHPGPVQLHRADPDGLPRPGGPRVRRARRHRRRGGPLHLRGVRRPVPAARRRPARAGRRAGRPRRRPVHEQPRDARVPPRRALRRRGARAAEHPALGGRDRPHRRALRGPPADRDPRAGRAGPGRGRAHRRRPRRGGRALRVAGGRRPGARRAGGRRARPARDQLHLGHDGAPQGRHVPPPWREPPGAGHGVPRAPGAGVALSVDPADVPLRRLVLPLGGHRRGRAARLPARDRRRGDLAAHPHRGGHALLRRTDRADDDRERGGGAGRPGARARHGGHGRRPALADAPGADERPGHVGDPPLRAHRDLRPGRGERLAPRVGPPRRRRAVPPQGPPGRRQRHRAAPAGARRADRRRGPLGRRDDGRARAARQRRDARLLPRPRGDRGGRYRRLVPHRRPRCRAPRRLRRDPRPQQGRDHLRRGEHRVRRGRARARQPPRGHRVGRGGRAGRAVGRGARRVRVGARGGRSRRAGRARAHAPREVQGAEADRVRRAAEDVDGEDPEERAARPGV
ncbi:MAG: 3-methylmercaptopropionyl-CoA ligase of DmdB1 type, partial [uncultured Actinomycetospora sp.]